MKSVIIIAIIVAIGVISVVVVIQQSEISDIRRQDNLESSVAQCNLIILNVNMFNNDAVNQARSDWEKCFDVAMDRYGNSFQKENWELQKQQTFQTEIKTLDETPSLDLDEYWALRYKEVSEPFEQQAKEIKQQVQEKELQAKQEEMDSCLENAGIIECMKSIAEKEKEEKPTCLSPNYRLKEYTVSVRYHWIDKNQNGFYCEDYVPERNKTYYEDDIGLK